MADKKLSYDDVRKLLGKTTPLPGAGLPQQSGNFVIPSPAAAASAPPAKTGIGALPANPVTDPGAILRAQESQAEGGMKRGGKVKRMKSGGSVRGCGIATKGHTKGTMR